MSTCCHPKKKWFKDPLFILSILGIATLYGANMLYPEHMLWHHFMDYVNKVWWTVLLGLFIGGIMEVLIPRAYFTHVLAGPKKRTIFYAVGLGFLMSTCSHGILAIAIQLYKKGASIPSTVAFLMAAPWANLPITLLMFAFFGWKAFLIMSSAIVIALITGWIYQLVDRQGALKGKTYEEEISSLDPNFAIMADMKARFKATAFNFEWFKNTAKGVYQGMLSLAQMVLWWIVIGIILSAITAALVPNSFFITYLNASSLGLFLTLCFATVIEVCSEGSAPLAFELYKQTGALGGAFVFLMAGVATDYTEIGLLWKNVGWRTAVLLPIITVPQIMVLGVIFNLFLS